jgi:hypothetical protein
MRRILLAVAAIVTIAVGLGVHALGSGFAADAAGDALYAVLIYLLAASVLRRGAWILALAWCIGVEFFQLTGRPAAWGSPWTLAFGSGFAWTDLLFYAVGVTLAAGVDHALLERRIRDDAGDRDAV